MLHYYPRHVSSINIPIFRRTNCIFTTSGIVALCKRLHSTPVKSGIKNCALKLVNEIILLCVKYSLGHCVFCFGLSVSVSVCYLDNSGEQIDDESGVAESKSSVLKFLNSWQPGTFADS
jgi:hypothetical protein